MDTTSTDRCQGSILYPLDRAVEGTSCFEYDRNITFIERQAALRCGEAGTVKMPSVFFCCFMMALSCACMKRAPRTGVQPPDGSEGAFLSVQTPDMVVWSRITDIALPYLGPPLDYKNPFPWVVVRPFDPNHLHSEISPDGLAVVRSMSAGLQSALRKRLNGMLERIRYRKLSEKAFAKAMDDGLLTCHTAITGVYDDSYNGPSGLACVNNLLLSLPEPLGKDHRLLSEEGTMPLFKDDPGVLDATPDEALPASSPAALLDFQHDLATLRRSVSWQEIRPIVEASTVFGTNEPDGANTCPGNLPVEMLRKDTLLALAVTAAVSDFRKTQEGFSMVSAYSRSDDPDGLWEDPCLPQMLGPSLEHAGIRLTIPEAVESCGSPVAHSP